MKIKIILGICLVVILSFGFYWFQVRSSKIRVICVDKISNKPGVAEELELQYKMCLRGHGLEK